MQKLFIPILVLVFRRRRWLLTAIFDSSFNLTGFANESFYGNVSRIRSLAIQPDGKIIAAGNAADNLFLNDFSIIRYNPSGSIDTSFGTGGRLYADVNGRPDVSPVVLLQADGKIIVVGNSQDNQNNLLSVLRFNANGTVDTSFGTNGVTTTRFQQTGSSAATPNDAIPQPDGKIVVAGG
ncbi:MAG: hypothetical protein IPN69_02245 [Acidobacteria bacterium]|nr:hypothetical protein [Acidobacteriota bacterium]